jgi:hypothetical protein
VVIVIFGIVRFIGKGLENEVLRKILGSKEEEEVGGLGK